MARWWILLALSSSLLLADQASKLWAARTLTRAFEQEQAAALPEQVRLFFTKTKLERQRTPPVVVHPDFFNFKYLENPGAAWGLFGSLPEPVRIPFFHAISAVSIGLLAWFYSRVREGRRLLLAALGLIVGGALGNFACRLARGYVIDFIDWHWRNRYHWPTFNVADIAISVGLACLVLDVLLGFRRSSEATEPISGLSLEAPPREDAATPAVEDPVPGDCPEPL
ncbi:signal peptidase II [Vulgatibacter incomptus]|uniref:Lipoprotein signal peptidase n=1 Tax=Vulgatibacter incomptus TaxID=1391653 RepID=A0A0K1PHF1_9BACT|nr:signal peptidase II [Vulgatibacter incomptus]AKU92826.1 Lipoprotein signal peptidase [Vulgatibacter incomptus]